MPKLSARALVSALPYRMKQQAEEEAYKIYTSDLQLALVKAVIKPNGAVKRYYEIINPKPEETRTGEEIIEYMKEKIREVTSDGRV